jgi:hypothetical protein
MGKTVKKIIDPFGWVLKDEKAEKPDPAVAPDPEASAADKQRAIQRRKKTGRTSTVLNSESNLG